MTLTTEVLIMIIVNVLAGGLYIGGLAAAMHFFEKQLNRVEVKTDKMNAVIEKIYHLEERADAQEKRLDELHDEVKELRGV